MSPVTVWQTLGITATEDRRAIKRAYAARLKTIDPDRDVVAFMALRDALAHAEAILEH